MNGKVATIFVGADSEIEQKEKIDRVDDAICATRSALEEGILPGGGIALLNCMAYLNSNTSDSKETEMARAILANSVTAPFEVIMENAEIEGIDDMFDYEKHFDIGIDASTGEICNMFERGIIDPFKVIKNELRNAVSVATTIMTTATTITQD